MTVDVTVQLIKSAGKKKKKKRYSPSSFPWGFCALSLQKEKYFPLSSSKRLRARAGLTEGRRQPEADGRTGDRCCGHGIIARML